jgi:hypothetical protein
MRSRRPLSGPRILVSAPKTQSQPTLRVGEVKFKSGGWLAGDLQLYSNAGNKGEMMIKSGHTVRVTISRTGNVTYQHKINGSPVNEPTKVTTTCIKEMLLTGIYQDEVITVGVRRDPELMIPK